jgi:polysaccharide export outer membrane protein
LQEIKEELEQKYTIVLRKPSLTLSPVKVLTRLEDLRSSVDNRFGSGGQGIRTRVMPDGMVRLPGLGSIPAQCLTLDELKLEVDERYRKLVPGIEVTPILQQRADRFVYVLGEVRTPGRFNLQQPTTVLMALAMAGGSTIGGNQREAVVFRRTDDWKLMATRIDINGAVLGKKPCPADEIWLRDSDVLLIPKSPLLRADNFIELAFTRGIYAIAPANTFFIQKSTFTQAR